MVLNKNGGKGAKSVKNNSSKKKITALDPDFENSFFAIVTTKPNGQMVGIKLIVDDNSSSVLNKYQLVSINAYLGKLKNDRRNSSLAPNDYVQVEINFDMKRKNGDFYAYVLCKYDKSEIKLYKRAGLITCDLDFESSKNTDTDIIDGSESDSSNGKEEESDYDIDNL